MGVQQSSSLEFDHFSHRFMANGHPLYPEMPNLKLLHERLTSKQYMLNVVTTNDQIQRLKLQNLICKKLANKSAFVTPVEQYIFDDVDGYCGRLTKCYLVFQIGKSSVKSLKHFLLEKQIQKERAFSDELLEESIQHVCGALLWLKFVDHRHGNFSTQNIYFDPQSNLFIVSDPWTAPLRENSIGQYPSPQKLAKVNNEVDHEDPFLSDLFSYGMIVLEIMFGRLSVYKANYKIDIKKIVQTVNLVERPSLKQKLRVMLVGSKQQKNVLLHSYVNVVKKVETTHQSKYQTRRTNSTPRVIQDQNGAIVGRDESQGFNVNAKFKTLGGLHSRSHSKSFRKQEDLRKNDKPPQVQLITNTNTNGYQKLSRLNTINTFTNFTNFSQNVGRAAEIKNIDQRNRQQFNYGQFNELNQQKINDKWKPQNSFEQKMPVPNSQFTGESYKNRWENQNQSQSFKRDNHGLMGNKNVQVATSLIFQSYQKEDFRPYYQGIQTQANFNRQKTNQFNQYQHAKKTDYSVLRVDVKNDIYTKNYQNKPFASDFTNLLPPELKKSQKFATQNTPNSTPSRNSNIFNSQNSEENIMHTNANLVGRINEGFNSLQNKITSAFTYESKIIQKQNEQIKNYKNVASNFSKNIDKQKWEDHFSTYSVKLKQVKQALEALEVKEKSEHDKSSRSHDSLKISPKEVKVQQESIDFPDTPSSLIKIDENKNTVQYACYLTKNSEQRVKSADRLKLSPNLEELEEMEAASPPTKAGPSGNRESEQFFLSYSYSDSNPGVSRRQLPQSAVQMEEFMNERSEQKISKESIQQQKIEQTQQIQNQTMSPTGGFPLKQVRNLIIYEESDGDSDSSTKQRQRGDPVQEIYQNGGRYKGYILDGKRDGQGTFYYKDGGYYQGFWKNNMMNGYGKLYYDTGKIAYEGHWYKDQFHGRGKVYNDSPQQLKNPFDYTDFQNIELYWQYYEGDLVHDSKEGSGKIMLSNGESFEGQFHNDKVHGKGIFKTLEGRIIRGIWQNCKLVKVIN